MRLADRAARLYAPLVHATAALVAISWLVAGRFRSRIHRHCHRRAHHHPPRAIALAVSGRAGGRGGDIVWQRRHSQRRRRHRAARQSGHDRIRQDGTLTLPRAARRREHRHRSRCARTGGAGRGKMHNNWSGSFGTPFARNRDAGCRSELDHPEIHSRQSRTLRQYLSFHFFAWITRAGTTLLRGIGVKTKVVFSITTTMPTRRLLAAVIVPTLA
jgi:hypothetical protein